MKTLAWLFPMGTVRGLFFSAVMASIYGAIILVKAMIAIMKNRKEFFATKSRTKPPKCLMDSKLGQHNFVQCQDIKLNYVSNGNPKRPLMLLLHGFPEMWYSLRHQLKEFSGDYFTVALNMRGFGDSDKPKGIAEYSLDKLVKDIKNFVHSMGKDKCILVSHDWGGIVGWAVAAHYPEIIDMFIVCNAPNVQYFMQTLKNDWTQFLKSWYIYFFHTPYLPEFIFRSNDYKIFGNLFKNYCTEEEIEGYKYYFSQPYGLSAPINYYRALHRGYAKQFIEQMENKRIKCPTLVIWGKEDMALSQSIAEDCCQLCDDYTIKYIDNCSHWTPLDKPDLVNKYIRDFLKIKMI